MMRLDLEAWWDEPEYKRCDTLSRRVRFILTKLLQRDPAALVYVMSNLYGAEKKDPRDITTHEWALILSHLGASPEEVSDMQKRMGRVWRDEGVASTLRGKTPREETTTPAGTSADLEP